MTQKVNGELETPVMDKPIDGMERPYPLEARDALQRLLRERAPRDQIEIAADTYIDAIRRYAKATKRKLPVPSRAFIIRFLS